jgi:tartrate dehydratase alpha subunit/fumarate hydratase class I-like protein
VPNRAQRRANPANIELKHIADHAVKAYKVAKGFGYTDDQILQALKDGDNAQKLFAEFLETFIIKKGELQCASS